MQAQAVGQIAYCLGLPPEAAFAAIERARGCPVPDTPEQRAWVTRFWQRYSPTTLPKGENR